MVAYSFKKQFVSPIRCGLGLIMPDGKGGFLPCELVLEPGKKARPFDPYQDLEPEARPKRQTIRANRKRHARAGEELQLYYGMRTKHCTLIGRAKCTEVRDIVLTFGKFSGVSIGGTQNADGSHQRVTSYAGAGLDDFARKDGFASWLEMVRFWEAEHGTLECFVGVLIEWEPLP